MVRITPSGVSAIFFFTSLPITVFIAFDGAKLQKSLVINVKNKTKVNQIDNILTFEVPFLVFLSQNYNIIGTEPEANFFFLLS